MDRLLRLGGGMPGLSQAPPPSDAPVVDTAEQVYISSLALLKMLKHGRAGVPMEVMGLMLGEFVDDYTVRVIDVFAMPQTGTVSNTRNDRINIEFTANVHFDGC
jgi:26S proteasome regulatory subunit N11